MAVGIDVARVLVGRLVQVGPGLVGAGHVEPLHEGLGVEPPDGALVVILLVPEDDEVARLEVLVGRDDRGRLEWH